MFYINFLCCYEKDKEEGKRKQEKMKEKMNERKNIQFDYYLFLHEI
jgi:hypothetical protein